MLMCLLPSTVCQLWVPSENIPNDEKTEKMKREEREREWETDKKQIECVVGKDKQWNDKKIMEKQSVKSTAAKQ